MKLPRFFYRDVFWEFDEYIASFPHRELHYRKGERLFGDIHFTVQDKFYYYFKSGLVVAIGTTDNDDRKILCYFSGCSFPPVDTTSEFYNIYQIVHYQALDDTVVYLFDYKAVTGMIQKSYQFTMQMINHTAELLALTIYQSVSQPLLSAESRLCDYLFCCIVHALGGKAEPYTIRIPQAQIAQYIGVTRTHISRIIHTLRDAGLLRTERGVIEIIDIDLLRQRCSSTFQMEF